MTAPVPDRVAAALRAAAVPVCAYVYDRAVLRERAGQLRSALPPGTRLLYAIKANGHPDVVAALASVVDGFEVASGGELELALAAEAGANSRAAPALPDQVGQSPALHGQVGQTTALHGQVGQTPALHGRIGQSGSLVRPSPGLLAFSGPAKTDEELRAAVAAGVLVHVESALELRRLAVAARDTGGTVEAAIRVNRAGAALPGTHQMTGAPTPFGVDERELPAVLALAATLPEVRLLGFHLHAVSNNLDATAHAGFIRAAVAWSVRTAAAHGFPLRYVNTGGGLGIDYTGPGHFDLGALGQGLRDEPAGAILALEPGRFLAADAGWYAAQVLDLKHTHGRWFAVLRGGTHHFRLPAAWGYSHPFAVLSTSDWPYPFPRPEVRDAVVDVVGELCTPRDVLARSAPIARLRVGDVLVFARTGAYGWDISAHEYLRHAYPEMIVI